MSDRYYGSINFGGKLKKELLPELLKVMEDQFFEPYDSDYASNLEDCIQNGRSFDISDMEACYGRFSDLENFLKENKMIYTACSGAYDFYMAEKSYFDGTVEKTWVCNNDFKIVVEKHIIDRHIQIVNKFFNDPNQIALCINSGGDDEEMAKIFSANNFNSAIEALEYLLNFRYDEPGRIPPLELID